MVAFGGYGLKRDRLVSPAARSRLVLQLGPHLARSTKPGLVTQHSKGRHGYVDTPGGVEWQEGEGADRPAWLGVCPQGGDGVDGWPHECGEQRGGEPAGRRWVEELRGRGGQAHEAEMHHRSGDAQLGEAVKLLQTPGLTGAKQGPPMLEEDGQLSRSEEHTSELQSRPHLECRLLLEKKKPSPETRPTTPPPSHAQRTGPQHPAPAQPHASNAAGTERKSTRLHSTH